MMAGLKQRVDAVNAGLGDLPKFQLGGQMVTQDNCVASWYFEKPIMNAPANRLHVGIGTSPNAMYFDSRRPDPKRYQFQAAATDTLDGMVWVGSAGEFTSDALIDLPPVSPSLAYSPLRHQVVDAPRILREAVDRKAAATR